MVIAALLLNSFLQRLLDHFSNGNGAFIKGLPNHLQVFDRILPTSPIQLRKLSNSLRVESGKVVSTRLVQVGQLAGKRPPVL